jgi:hypothetical protein
MDKKLLAALAPGLLAFVGVELASLFGFSSTAARVIAGAAGAVGGVMLANEL